MPRTDTPPPPPFAYSWLSPEDAIRHALASFYTACRYHDHSARAFPDGPFGSRENWLNDFVEIFSTRLQLADASTGGEYHATDIAELTNTLEGFTEPCWHDSILPDRENTADIHCRAFQLTEVARRAHVITQGPIAKLAAPGARG